MAVVLCADKFAVAEARGGPVVAPRRHVDKRAQELGFDDGSC